MDQLLFECKYNELKWKGKITDSRKYESHYHINISAKDSGISVYFGRAFGGWFVCIPNWNAGVIIGSLSEIWYNAEKIGTAMDNMIDGHSVAYALDAYAKSENIEEHDDTDEFINMLKKAGFECVED